jgi:hypothetical protein
MPDYLDLIFQVSIFLVHIMIGAFNAGDYGDRTRLRK